MCLTSIALQLTRVGETTPKAATFHTACVWRWGSDLETGNYVPPGETPPGKLLESRIQSEPGALCQFSYAVDTVHDKSLWNAQQKVEEYIVQVKGFNRSKKPRRPWQDGSENNTSVYIMGSQIFFKRTKSTSRREASVKYKLHPWIEKAAKQSAWFPNPDRPIVLEPCNGVLRDINDSVPPYLRTGDLVWISFFVEFVIGINHWSTTFSPREIIRVGTVSSDLVGDQPPGVTLLEGSEDRLRAGDKISIRT
ncbi:hypothetical protein FKP32DRAFT_1571416 [Trametes sanguinea]|nr:hypothetical protein FKP32DRAFT_1571416 [Trametes sanguinea]